MGKPTSGKDSERKRKRRKKKIGTIMMMGWDKGAGQGSRSS